MDNRKERKGTERNGTERNGNKRQLEIDKNKKVSIEVWYDLCFNLF